MPSLPRADSIVTYRSKSSCSGQVPAATAALQARTASESATRSHANLALDHGHS